MFESYITELFNQKKFKLVEWRKSQRTRDTLTLINYSFPDLEVIFEGRKKHKFAIECKWRKRFKEGKIKWADEEHIRTYEAFEKYYGIPVFVAIGIGGEPSMPEKLFVTPLCNISKYTEVYESDLILFERKTARRFFYDTVQLKLL